MMRPRVRRDDETASNRMLKRADQRTVLYLIRHGATEANLARPALIQGRAHNPPLARLGVRQAEATRDFLAVRPIDHCYASPLLRAMQTASLVAAPHGLAPVALEELTECDVGRWEGLDWQTIRGLDADGYRRFHADPAEFGYPGGESFRTVHDRVLPVIDELLERHRGETVLIVAHHVVNRVYLADLLGLAVGQARQVKLDNCGISVVVRDGDETTVNTLNAAFHLQGVAA
jgi:broad specificity phosphatase PhoE